MAVKLDYWAKKLQRDLRFKPEEIAQGIKHPFIQRIAPFQPGSELNTILVNFLNMVEATFKKDGTTFQVSVTSEEVFEFATLFFKGMRYAQEHSTELGHKYLFPKDIMLKSSDFFKELEIDEQIAGYIPPKDTFKNPQEKFDSYYDSIVLHEVFFAEAAYHKMHKSCFTDNPHPILKDKPLSWDERLFLLGVEEMRHLYQYKDDKLSSVIDKKIDALGDNYNPHSYGSDNPVEADAGEFMVKALQEYRKSKDMHR